MSETKTLESLGPLGKPGPKEGLAFGRVGYLKWVDFKRGQVPFLCLGGTKRRMPARV